MSPDEHLNGKLASKLGQNTEEKKKQGKAEKVMSACGARVNDHLTNWARSSFLGVTGPRSTLPFFSHFSYHLIFILKSS